MPPQGYRLIFHVVGEDINYYEKARGCFLNSTKNNIKTIFSSLISRWFYYILDNYLLKKYDLLISEWIWEKRAYSDDAGSIIWNLSYLLLVFLLWLTHQIDHLSNNFVLEIVDHQTRPEMSLPLSLIILIKRIVPISHALPSSKKMAIWCPTHNCIQVSLKENRHNKIINKQLHYYYNYIYAQ